MRSKRAPLSGGDHLVRLVLVHDHQRIGADDVVEGHGNGLLPADLAGVHHILDQLDDDLGVGLALEMVALAGQFGLQGLIVLDDAVVDQGQPAVLGIMRMGIHVARLAVRRPAGVSDAGRAGHVLSAANPLQVLDLSLGLVDGQVSPFADERHAGAVVSPIFKPSQPFDQDRKGFTPSHVTYDSAHMSLIKNFSNANLKININSKQEYALQFRELFGNFVTMKKIL